MTHREPLYTLLSTLILIDTLKKKKIYIYIHIYTYIYIYIYIIIKLVLKFIPQKLAIFLIFFIAYINFGGHMSCYAKNQIHRYFCLVVIERQTHTHMHTHTDR